MFRMSNRGVMGAAAAWLLLAGSAWAADAPSKAAPAAPEKAGAGKAPTAQAAAGKAGAAADEIAVMETTKGRMVIEFWPKEAPQTVANFKKLAKQGFFDGTGFHRIIKGFMIQGGDPKSKNPKAPDLGTGDPGYKIPDEFNSHPHVKGVLSMANASMPNTGGSQFFIMHTTYPSLDGKYTVFGHLIEGMDVLDAIANSPVGPSSNGEMSKPLEWTTVKTVRIMPRAAYTAKKGETAKAASANKAAADKRAADAKAAAAARLEESKKNAEALKAKMAAEKAVEKQVEKSADSTAGGAAGK